MKSSKPMARPWSASASSRARARLTLRRTTAPRWSVWLTITGIAVILSLLVTVWMWSRTDALVASSLLRSQMALQWPLLHLVHTRFQQDQPNLLFLGRARLLLFQTFCLPTMVAQTSSEFIWIIHTDPKLHHELRSQLRAMLLPYPRFYLIGSNHRFNLDNDSSWRENGKLLLKSTIYCGDIALLRQVYVTRHTRPVLETRLDADDGLHSDYLSVIQSAASIVFASTEQQQQQQQWMYWCSKRHLEWFLGDMLQPVEHSKLCISAGITVGYNVNSGTIPVPHYPHDVLYKKIVEGHCAGAGAGVKVCIRLLEELPFGAIRSRTPTSAGMMGVDEMKRLSTLHEHEQHSARFWNVVHEQFHIPSTVLVTSYLRDHMVEIAKDNLAGQCTVGHSCKMQAKEDLQRLIETRGLVGLVDPS